MEILINPVPVLFFFRYFEFKPSKKRSIFYNFEAIEEMINKFDDFFKDKAKTSDLDDIPSEYVQDTNN